MKLNPQLAERAAQALLYYKGKPVEFVEDVIGAKPDAWQAAVLRSMFVDGDDKVAVASCTGAGKSALDSWVILYVLTYYEFCKILVTAPSAHLLSDVLWSEVHQWLRKAKFLPLIFEWSATTIRHRVYPEEWFAAARTTSSRKSDGTGDKQAEGLAGIHAKHVLVLIDEASGVPVEIFDALENTLTGDSGGIQKILVTGNPLRVDGRFFEIFNKVSIAEHWRKFSVSALAHDYSPKSDDGQAYIAKYADTKKAQARIDAYGLKSPSVQARVFGRFPVLQSDDTGFSFQEVIDAMKRRVVVDTHDEVQIGVDCARFGDDETVFQIRRGWRVRTEVMAMSSAPDIAAKIIELCEEEIDLTRPEYDHRPLVLIDEAGAGGGGAVCDLLWLQGYTNVIGVSFGAAARNEERFFNCAAEMWLDDLRAAMPHLELPDDERLLHQLITRKYEYTGKAAQRRVESKDKMKRRGLGSPDRADALCLAVARPAMPGIF
jgi:phage terminase large subunit